MAAIEIISWMPDALKTPKYIKPKLEFYFLKETMTKFSWTPLKYARGRQTPQRRLKKLLNTPEIKPISPLPLYSAIHMSLDDLCSCI